ncbi:MAG: hypothetical protein ACRC14_13485 [Paracoccaceae bacterium]
MGFITELISGDKKRAHEAAMAADQNEEDRMFMEQMAEQTRMANEQNTAMLEMLGQNSSESNDMMAAMFGGGGSGTSGGNGGGTSGGDGGTSSNGPVTRGGPVDYSNMFAFDKTSNSFQTRTTENAQNNLDKAIADPFYNPWTQKRDEGSEGGLTEGKFNMSMDRARAYADMFGLDFNKAASEQYGKPDAPTEGSSNSNTVRSEGDTDSSCKETPTSDKTTTSETPDESADMDEADTAGNKDKKIDDLESSINELKYEVDYCVDSGELSKDEGAAIKADLDKKLKAAKDGEGTEAVDKAQKEVDTLDNNLDDTKHLKARVGDVKAEIAERVETGDLTQEQADKLNAKIDQQVGAVNKGEVEVDAFIGDLNVLDNKLTEKFEPGEGADPRTADNTTRDDSVGLVKEFEDITAAEPKSKDEIIDDVGDEFDAIAPENEAKTKKIDELQTSIGDAKSDIDDLVKSGDISKDDGAEMKANLDDKLKAAQDGEGTEAADKALKEVDTLSNNLGKMEELNKSVSDAKAKVDARVESGDLSKDEGAKLKATMDEKVDAVQNGEADADGLMTEIGKLDRKINNLSKLDDRAAEVTKEIDQRVKDGELSQEAGDKAKADIKENVSNTRETLLDLDGANTSAKGADGETPKRDWEVRRETVATLDEIDGHLDKLAGLDVKADAAKDRIGAQVKDGSLSKDEGAKMAAEIDAKQKATELHTLEWA